MTATVTERRCRRCGILASEAARQGEPICNDHGLVGGHSYLDMPVPPRHETQPEPEGRKP